MADQAPHGKGIPLRSIIASGLDRYLLLKF
jgi:hypothetical protein